MEGSVGRFLESNQLDQFIIPQLIDAGFEMDQPLQEFSNSLLDPEMLDCLQDSLSDATFLNLLLNLYRYQHLPTQYLTDFFIRSRNCQDFFDWLSSLNSSEYFLSFTLLGFFSEEDVRRLHKNQLEEIGIDNQKLTPRYAERTLDWFFDTFIKNETLMQYKKLFKDKGFNAVKDLYNITMRDMKNIGILKVGHQNALKQEIVRAKQYFEKDPKCNSGTQDTTITTSFLLQCNSVSLYTKNPVPVFKLIFLQEKIQNSVAVDTLSIGSDLIKMCNEFVLNSCSVDGKKITFSDLDNLEHFTLGVWGDQKAITNFLFALFGQELSFPDTSAIYSFPSYRCIDNQLITIVLYWEGKQNSEISQHNPTCRFVTMLSKLCNDMICCLDTESCKKLSLTPSNTQKSRIRKCHVSQKVLQEDAVSLSQGFTVVLPTYTHWNSFHLAEGTKGCPAVIYHIDIPPSEDVIRESKNISKTDFQRFFDSLAQNRTVTFSFSTNEFDQKRIFLENFYHYKDELLNLCDIKETIAKERGDRTREMNSQIENSPLYCKYIKTFYTQIQSLFPLEFEESKYNKLLSEMGDNEDNTNVLNNFPNSWAPFSRHGKNFVSLRIRLIWAEVVLLHFENAKVSETVIFDTAIQQKDLDSFISTLNYKITKKIFWKTSTLINKITEYINDNPMYWNDLYHADIIKEFEQEVSFKYTSFSRYVKVITEKQYTLQITEELERKRQELEQAEIEILISGIKEKYNCGLELKISNISQKHYSTCLEYYKTMKIDSQLKIEVYPLILKKYDEDKLSENLEYRITPIVHHTTYNLKYPGRIIAEYSISGSRLLVICTDNDKSSIIIFGPQKTPIFEKSYSRVFTITDFDETSRLLLLYWNTNGIGIFTVLRLNENLQTVSKIIDDIPATHIPGTDSESLQGIKLIPSQNQLIFITDKNILRKFDITLGKWPENKVQLKNMPKNYFFSPKGEILFIPKVKLDENGLEKLTFKVLMSQNFKRLPSIITDLDPAFLNTTTIAKYGSESNNQTYIIQFQHSCIKSSLVNITTQEQFYQVQQVDNKISDSNSLVQATALDYIFYIYDKFSIQGELETPRGEMNFSVLVDTNNSNDDFNYFSECIKSHFQFLIYKLKKTEKPFNELGLEKNFNIIPLKDVPNRINSISTNQQKIGNWVKKLIYVVPIQIARTETNEFFVFSDGSYISGDIIYKCAFDFAYEISFGFYDAIFLDWNGPVKCITSMGKQSTGKSYSLNHLTGSIFDISGARCTDGAWMTTVITPECLYVVMDFEGLGSFERTEQEDMLLSVLNSAISNLTLFKTEFRLDRDTEQMFSRFQGGVNLIKGSDKLFKGSFCIVIKDVADRDIDQIAHHFQEKMSAIVSRNDKENFVSQMYNGEFIVQPFPPLGKREYYEELEHIKSNIQDKKSYYESASDFRNMLVHLLAKIAVKDWTSLDRQELQIRIRFIQEHSNMAISYGCLPAEDLHGDTPLCKIDTKEIIADKHIEFIDETTDDKNIISINTIPDSLVALSIETKDINYLATHQKLFENIIPRTDENFLNWKKSFQLFLSAIVYRRIERVEEWVRENLAKWDMDDEIQTLKNFIQLRLKSLLVEWSSCNFTCAQCCYDCVLPLNHSIAHSCETDHQCSFFCDYCQEVNTIKKCFHRKGHSGKHNCGVESHTCKEGTCYLSKFGKCNLDCSLPHGHTGDHKCNSKMHICNEQCSNEICKLVCQINAEINHSVHKCHEQHCNAICTFEGCKYTCSVQDHFHAYPNLSSKYKLENGISSIDETVSSDHMCANSHQCKELCQCEGICYISVETVKDKKEAEFVGKRQTFTYTITREANGIRKRCCVEILPGYKNHNGSHVHSTKENVLHWCDVKCPSCGYFCELEFGHAAPLHKTSHGNMRNAYFVSDQNEFEVGDRKYVAGEVGTAEMCHLFCNKMGRGHLHIELCDAPNGETCTHSKVDGRQHAITLYEPNRNIPKDELNHEAYWNSIGFEDPCTIESRENFKKCPYNCGLDHVDSDGVTKYREYCQLPLWHEPADKSKKYPIGFVSKDGHLFSCSHTSGLPYHIVLALDDSGSMNGQAWVDLRKAVENFIRHRLENGGNKDLISIVIHNSTARIECLMQPISYSLMNYVSFQGGGNDFKDAVLKSIQCISSTNTLTHTPVFLFMSDGVWDNGNEEMVQVKEKFSAHNIIVYTMGFGQADANKLQTMANCAGGTFKQSIDGIALTNAFVEISAEISAKVSLSRK